MSSQPVISTKYSSVVPQKVTAGPSKPVSQTPSVQQSGSPTSANQSRNHSRRRNRHSHGKNGKPTGNPSQQQSQQGNGQHQKQVNKQGNWKGGHQPRPKLRTPKISREPVYEYASVCCGVRALKPRAAGKTQVTDPETKKPKTEIKGLGHWRCPNCKKNCKVTRRKPEPKPDTVPILSTVVPTEGTSEPNSI